MKPLILAVAMLFAAQALAETSEQAMQRRPDLFHADTGYRIDRQRAPTPTDVPGAGRISAEEVAALKNAVRIDVFGAAQSRYDELDGTWLVAEQRLSLPDAIWLPEVGRGILDETMQRYFAENLARLTGGCKDRTLILFCVADCWMSWNAVQRAALLGYTDVRWFREGTDGWLDAGFGLEPVEPVPVLVE